VPAESPLVHGLPQSPCVGRIWEPVNEVPDVNKEAVVSIFDVRCLEEAWDVVVKLVELEPRIFEKRCS
jgi:hypothetical protein